MKYKNYRNSYTNEDKIYSRKNIADMSVREAFSRKDEIMAQHNSIGIPSEGELKSSPNAVWVESYTRDDGTEVRGYWRSRPEGSTENNSNDNVKSDDITTDEQGTVTGGASDIKQEVKEEKDVPEMTKSAEMQENTIKNMPVWEVKINPEQEYYRIAFELKEAKENGNIPDWMNEHNDIRTLDKVGNEENKKALKEKIIQGAKDNNDIETLNNLDGVYVITAKPDSNLTKSINNSSYFKQEIDKRITEIESGEYEKASFPISFPDSEFSTHNAIGRCDVHNVKVEPNGDISATIIDYYDFDKRSNNPIIKNGYIQQQNGHLKNYALMIPIRIRRKK